MWFRGRQPESSVWKRFRSGADGFSFVKEGDYYAAHVVANAERAVDLFHTLTQQLPPAVDVVVTDKRSGTAWKGESLALPDVRDAIARIRVPLAAHGGIELAVFTTDDQLTLNPVLELFIYARTDQWLYILQGLGLEEQRVVPTKSWKLGRQQFPPAPELVEAVTAMAERLGLTRA